MKEEKTVRYEKPSLEKYRFAMTVAVGASPDDILEECDSGFDE